MSQTLPVSISVIIPAKDAQTLIERCLQAVLVQKNVPPFEVIVVDDGSSDRTALLAEAFGVQVIRQPNAGPAAARNAGAQAARGQILAFTDVDCAPAPDWLANQIQPLLEDPQIVAAKGVYCSPQKGLVPRFVQAEYQSKYRRMAGQSSIDFVDTYSAAYRRDVFLQNGGFDTSFRVPSVEDQELSFRLSVKGYRMVFVPQAAVEHIHDRNLPEYLARKFGIGYWKAYMLRWLPEKTLSDSHTPPTLRWQMLCLALTLLSVFLLPWLGGWLVAISFALFWLVSLPFLTFLAATDPAVLWIAPLMLLARALSLSAGLVWGTLAPPHNGLSHPGLSMGARLGKRALDILGGAVGCLLSLPMIALAAIAIKLDSPGPVFFRQQRAGENGRPFWMIKLRTMVQDAESRVSEVLADNPLAGPAFKIPNDPRITRVGRFLRRWSLDELPQFWNVLRGVMSLVGPRPEEIWVVEQYNDRQRQRLRVKPGLTGPMQVSGRGTLDMETRLQLEIEYIENYSLARDFAILLRTIPAMLSGKGAF